MCDWLLASLVRRVRLFTSWKRTNQVYSHFLFEISDTDIIHYIYFYVIYILTFVNQYFVLVQFVNSGYFMR